MTRLTLAAPGLESRHCSSSFLVLIVRSRLSVLGLASVIAAVVMACGPAAPTTGSYVAQFTNGAAYLAWTRTDKSVSGNFSQALWRDGDTALTNEAFSVTGTADGNGISLKLDEGLGLGPTSVGTFNGDQLTLTFPSTNGKVNQYVFRPGTQSDYEGMVAKVQTQVDEANAAAEALRQQQEADQQAAAAAAQRQAALDQGVTDAAAALQSTLDDADQQVGAYGSAVADMETGLGAVKDAYQTMLDEYNGTFVPSLAVRPMDDYQVGTVSYNLGALDYDNGAIAYQLDNVRSYHGDQATSARSDASTDLAAVESQVKALEQALAADPGYAPAVTAAAARSARDRLGADVATLDKRRATALSTAKSYETKGNTLYAKAKKSAKAVGAS
jgi:hypothetical protein